MSDSQSTSGSDSEDELFGQFLEELSGAADKEVVIRMRIYVAGQRLYQTMAMGPRKFAQSKDVALFLDSFKLSK